MYVSIDEFIGKTFTTIDINDEENIIIFTTDEHKKYKMFHKQDCCESVYLEDIAGNIPDLLNSPITMAEEVSNSTNNEYDESETWTYQKLATIKGYVTLRWYGSSNGYYSESVDIEEIEE